MEAGPIGSQSWCDSMTAVLAGVEVGDTDRSVVVEQRLLDDHGSPEIAYRLVLSSGEAHLRPVGEDEPPADVVLSQSRAVAASIRSGELGALAALQAGLITLSGDVRVLVAVADALTVVDQALATAPAQESGA